MGTARHARGGPLELPVTWEFSQVGGTVIRLVKMHICSRQLACGNLRIEARAVVSTWRRIQPREVQAGLPEA